MTEELDSVSERLATAHFDLREELKRIWSEMDAQQSRPRIIFHYTSADALHGIISKKVLWATEALCMNDPTEGIHAGRLIADRLSQSVPDIPDTLTRLFSDEQLSEVMNDQVFIISFCSAGDLLNQWRAYGLEGRGYAIGFNVQVLLNTAPEGGHLVPVSYDKDQLYRLLDAIIAFARVYLNRVSFKKEEVERYWKLVANYLMHSVMRFKNPAYHEEREWRLIYLPSGRTEFRTAASRIVPYIQVPFGLEAIESIMVGPKCSTRDKRVLTNYLRSIYGPVTPTIESSVVPMA